MAKLTLEEQMIDREIKRINNQIKQAYTKLGAESRLAKQYETILLESRGKNQAPAHIRTMQKGETKSAVTYKDGIPQISRSTATIRAIKAGAGANAVMQLGRMQTVQQAQKAMIKAFEKRTGQQAKGRKAQQAALQEERQRYQRTQGAFAALLGRYYTLEKQLGVRFRSHDEIQKLSKGYWTSDEDFSRMRKIVEDDLNAEKIKVVDDVLAGY